MSLWRKLVLRGKHKTDSILASRGPYLPDTIEYEPSRPLHVLSMFSPRRVWHNVKHRLEEMVSKAKQKTGRSVSSLSSSVQGVTDEAESVDVPPEVQRKRMTEDEELLLSSSLHFHPVEVKMLKQYFQSLCTRSATYTVFRGRTEDSAPDERELYLTRERLHLLFFSRSRGEQEDHSSYILDTIFNAVNLNKDGYVSFFEFAQSMSVCLHGSFRERATCTLCTACVLYTYIYIYTLY